MASASKYSLLIRVWFSPVVTRLLSIQSCSKSCKSPACFGASRRPSASCTGPAFFAKNSAEPAALLYNSHLTATTLVSTASKPGFNLSRTVASSPQRKGDIVALRRLRKVSADNRTHFPAKARCSPVGQSQPPARPQDTRHLRNNGRGERRKHDPEHRNQHVKTAVWIGKCFGKAFVEGDGKSFASRARPSLLQQMRHHIQAGDPGPAAG